MRKKIVRVYLPQELIDNIKYIGKLEGTYTSFIIRTVIKDYVDYYMHRLKNKKEDEQ